MNDGIRWSGKDPTKAKVIGKLITKTHLWGKFVGPEKEYNVVEITENGTIYIVDSWYKSGVPQLIGKECVKEYKPNENEKT